MIPLAEFVRITPFFLVAHRGASGIAPENTLRALQLALDARAVMVEIDVQTTADDELIVFHDAVLGRTTNGHGHVRNKRLSELRELDAGSWFDEASTGERIPMLHEALDLIEGRAYLNVEVKPLSEDPHAGLVARTLVRTIQDRGMLPYTVFSSFDHAVLRELKQASAGLHTCALNVPGDNRLPTEILSACAADAFGCSLRELSHTRADSCHAHSIPLGVYTVNTPDQLAIAQTYGVNAVVTNFPSIWTQPGLD
jgi:glycerophosphoryl diester phosphodiesterase